jgi:hypothetical protein
MKFDNLKRNQVKAMALFFMAWPCCRLQALGRSWTRQQFLAAYVRSRMEVTR